MKLKELVDKKNSEAEIKEAKAKMMNEVGRIMSLLMTVRAPDFYQSLQGHS